MLAALAVLGVRGWSAPAATGTTTLFSSSGSSSAALQQSFLNAYLKCTEAEQEEKQGDMKRARADYKLVLKTLQDIGSADPKWETVMLARCEEDCQDALARVDSAGAGASKHHQVVVAASAPPDETLFSGKQSLQECYLAAYVELCEANRAQRRGSTGAAISDYKVTLNTLVDIQKADPNWETALVVHRIADCRMAISQLEAK